MAERKELVLVGGGHAHVQVLRGLADDPIPGVRTTLVLDRPEAVYSGMVPGFVAGDYEAHELEIDGVPLARRAGARVVLAAATGIDPEARCIELAGRPPVAYDVASLDVGSTVRGLELPGVADHALATRPIRRFVDRLEERVRAAREARGAAPLRVAVVGAGAAGVELGFTLEHRLRRAGVAAEITLLAASRDVLPGHPGRVARRVRRLARARGLGVRCGVRVHGAERDALRVAASGGPDDRTEGAAERLPCDLVLWAAGAAPPPWLARAPLPHDERGFVRVRETLQVVGHDGLFAVGDCAVPDEHPWVPRAGVYAVRQGPPLESNLRAALAGAPWRRYRPQRDFLMLLNLGGGRALGAKWGLTARGRLVWRLKDAIDRRFVRRFRVPAHEDADAGEGRRAPLEWDDLLDAADDPWLRERAEAVKTAAEGAGRSHRVEPGDALVLTRPLGAAAVLAAHASGRATGAEWQAILRVLTGSPAAALGVARGGDADAVAAVAGLGLAGHLEEILAKSGVAARLSLAAIPFLPGAAAHRAREVVSGEREGAGGVRVGAGGERVGAPSLCVDPELAGDARVAILGDPEPGSALLLAVPADRAEALAAAFRETGERAAAIIGRVTEPAAVGPRLEVRP